MQHLIITLLMLFSTVANPENHLPEDLRNDFVAKINRVRQSGCYCGRYWMPSVPPLTWNDTLYESALHHAKEMHKYGFFAHYSITGKNIGTRLSEFGYDWQMAGENIGEGQDNFDEVLEDWINSRSHCRMLMSPKVTEVAVARYGKFWVQHFGKKMPSKRK